MFRLVLNPSYRIFNGSIYPKKIIRRFLSKFSFRLDCYRIDLKTSTFEEKRFINKFYVYILSSNCEKNYFILK